MESSSGQRRVLEALREGPGTAKAIGARLGIDASAVRRHLAALEASALVASEDRIAGRGRPKRFYNLTAEGAEIGPRSYGLLLNGVLGKIAERHGHAELHRILEKLAAEISPPAASDDGDPAARVAALYNRLGFDASIEASPDGPVLVQRNCPFLKTARRYPEAMCQVFDRAVARGAAPGADIRLLASQADGAPVCRHLLATARARRKPV